MYQYNMKLRKNINFFKSLLTIKVTLIVNKYFTIRYTSFIVNSLNSHLAMPGIATGFFVCYLTNQNGLKLNKHSYEGITFHKIT